MISIYPAYYHTSIYNLEQIQQVAKYYNADKILKIISDEFIHGIRIVDSEKTQSYIKNVLDKCDYESMETLYIQLVRTDILQRYITEIFPYQYQKLMNLFYEIKSSQSYMGYMYFLTHGFLQSFGNVIYDQYQKINQYDVLQITDFHYSVIQQSFEFYQFYCQYYFSNIPIAKNVYLFHQLSVDCHKLFDINEIIQQIKLQNLYSVAIVSTQPNTTNSQSIMNFCAIQQPVKYESLQFRIYFDQIYKFWKSKVFKLHHLNGRCVRYDSTPSVNQLSEIFKNTTMLYLQNDSLILKRLFKNFIIRVYEVQDVYLDYEQYVDEYQELTRIVNCSVCKQQYCKKELFSYNCCNQLICMQCFYNYQYRHAIIQPSMIDHKIYMCPACGNLDHNKTIQTYILQSEYVPEYSTGSNDHYVKLSSW